jgi:hypothetical protein
MMRLLLAGVALDLITCALITVVFSRVTRRTPQPRHSRAYTKPPTPVNMESPMP